MTAVLGTLPFLATLWLLAILGAKVLEESGGKIAAALRGEVPRHAIIREAAQRRRGTRARSATVVRASLRAAA